MKKNGLMIIILMLVLLPFNVSAKSKLIVIMVFYQV